MNFDIGTWRDQVLYTCKLDAFDTLDLEVMLEHQTLHPQAEEVPVEMGRISVLTTATVLIAANVYRNNLTLQHVGTDKPTAFVWVSQEPAMVEGDGFLLNGLGTYISISKENGATTAWYAIASISGVNVVVQAGNW